MTKKKQLSAPEPQLKDYRVIIFVLGFSLVVAVLLTIFAGRTVFVPFVTAPTPTYAPVAVEKLSYKGEKGKDALTILKEKAAVEQASSGLVVRINNRKADDKKHEFWAFYVNGKFASVGPAVYQTKDTDTILWKIEKY